jgi:hypothetical protein
MYSNIKKIELENNLLYEVVIFYLKFEMVKSY